MWFDVFMCIEMFFSLKHNLFLWVNVQRSSLSTLQLNAVVKRRDIVF